MTMERGEIAHLMLTAALAGKPFEQVGVPDSLHDRDLYEQMQSEIENREPGQVVDIPSDWAGE